MNNSFPNPEPGNYPQAEVKTVLLRLAVFVLALFGTHVLQMWLHPLGAHRFFWNLTLGALSFWAILRFAMPHFKDESPKVDPY